MTQDLEPDEERKTNLVWRIFVLFSNLHHPYAEGQMLSSLRFHFVFFSKIMLERQREGERERLVFLVAR